MKKFRWNQESGGGPQWKSLLKVNLTLHCYIFCMWAERGNEGGCGENGQQASTLIAADFQAKDSRATNLGHLHTEVKKIDCKEHIQPQREGAHTDTQSEQPRTGKAPAQKSARHLLILSMWSLGDREREGEWKIVHAQKRPRELSTGPKTIMWHTIQRKIENKIHTTPFLMVIKLAKMSLVNICMYVHCNQSKNNCLFKYEIPNQTRLLTKQTDWKQIQRTIQFCFWH